MRNSSTESNHNNYDYILYLHLTNRSDFIGLLFLAPTPASFSLNELFSSHLTKLSHQSFCTLGLPSDQIPNKNMGPTDFPICNFCLCYAGNVNFFVCLSSIIAEIHFTVSDLALFRFSENSKICLVNLDGSILSMCPKIGVIFSSCLCIPLFHHYYQVYKLVRLCIMDLIFFKNSFFPPFGVFIVFFLNRITSSV